MKVTTASGPVVYSLQDNPAHFELSEDQFADGSQKIIYTGGLNESQVVVLIAVVSTENTSVISEVVRKSNYNCSRCTGHRGRIDLPGKNHIDRHIRRNGLRQHHDSPGRPHLRSALLPKESHLGPRSDIRK